MITTNPVLLWTSVAMVGVCWYDRRADNENFGVRRHCGESSNTGATFSESDIGMPPFAPTHGIDLFINPIYMGDYDQLTSDFLNSNSGFIGVSRTRLRAATRTRSLIP